MFNKPMPKIFDYLEDQGPCPICNRVIEFYAGKPIEFEICNGCGVQFGYDDCSVSWAELKEAYIAAGSPFWPREVMRRDLAPGLKTWLEVFHGD